MYGESLDTITFFKFLPQPLPETNVPGKRIIDPKHKRTVTLKAGSILTHLNIQVESENKGKNSHCFIVIATCYRP